MYNLSEIVSYVRGGSSGPNDERTVSFVFIWGIRYGNEFLCLDPVYRSSFPGSTKHQEECITIPFSI